VSHAVCLVNPCERFSDYTVEGYGIRENDARQRIHQDRQWNDPVFDAPLTFL
jgi:hypothetical protein